jgi:hypothetical protein
MEELHRVASPFAANPLQKQQNHAPTCCTNSLFFFKKFPVSREFWRRVTRSGR